VVDPAGYDYFCNVYVSKSVLENSYPVLRNPAYKDIRFDTRIWSQIYVSRNYLGVSHGFYPDNPIFIRNIKGNKAYLVDSELPSSSIKQQVTYIEHQRLC
jgi:hypothetical protein